MVQPPDVPRHRRAWSTLVALATYLFHPRRVPIRFIIALSCQLTSGCILADQSGQIVPHDVYQHGKQPLGEASFHFRTGLNYASVVGRMVLLAGALVLLRRCWRSSRRQLPVCLFVLAMCLGLGWFAITGASKVWRYKLSVDDSRLVIQIPFQADIDAPWDEVWGVTVEGKQWREGFDTLYTEWSKIEIVLRGNRRVEFDLDELGVVQRSNFMKALQHRSKMRSLEVPY